MSTWKNAERRAAAALGGKRHLRASHSESACDVDHPLLSIEVKYRKRLPVLVTSAMEQAVGYAKGTSRIPAVVLFEKGKPGALVVMRMSDFGDWFGKIEKKNDDPA